MEKVCRKCKEFKTLESFPKMKKGKYGVGGSCKDCLNRQAREVRLTPEGQLRLSANKARWYEKNPDYNKEYYQNNKEKVTFLNNRWKEKNPTYMKEYLKDYSKEYLQRPEVKEACRIKSINRYRKLSGVLPKDTMVLISQMHLDGKFYCMNPNCLSPDDKLTIDHVVPVSKGGLNTLDNVQILCFTCNRIKGNRSSADYRQIKHRDFYNG